MEYYGVVFKGEILEHAYRGRSPKPGQQGYGEEQRRAKEGQDQAKYNRWKTRLDRIVREYQRDKQKYDALVASHKNNMTEQIMKQLGEYYWSMSNNIQLALGFVDEYPALKSQVPGWFREIMDKTTYMPLNIKTSSGG